MHQKQNLKEEPLHPLNTLTVQEIEKLLAVKQSHRDYCMILMMLDTGLRVGELVKLKQSDLYFYGSCVTQLTVRAEISKTKTERTIPVSARLIAAIQVLKTRVWYKDGAIRDHYAFYTAIPNCHITSRQVERIVGWLGQTYLGRRLTPHMLRHTFGTRVLRKSNIRIAQKLLGHKRITSTQIYTHPSGEECVRAIADISCH